MKENLYNKFAKLKFDDFRHMAKDKSLSKYEKIGFPDNYRDGYDEAIFKDILLKLPNLKKRNQTILDIGPGCSNLAFILIEYARKQEHELTLVDSQEMLDQLPDEPFIRKIAAYYPKCSELFQSYSKKIDVILSYSVLHYIFVESNLWEFLDKSLSLLSHGGEMLMGDIPNISKRKRFFSSPEGIRFHQNFTGTKELPELNYNNIENEHIDDSVLFSMIMRTRSSGFDAYILPQSDELPMANRREDILIKRP